MAEKLVGGDTFPHLEVPGTHFAGRVPVTVARRRYRSPAFHSADRSRRSGPVSAPRIRDICSDRERVVLVALRRTAPDRPGKPAVVCLGDAHCLKPGQAYSLLLA